MAEQPPLNYVFYVAATPEKVWERQDIQAALTPTAAASAWRAPDTDDASSYA